MDRRNRTRGTLISKDGALVLWIVCRERLLQKEEEIKAAKHFNNGQKSKNWDIIKQKITTAKVTCNLHSVRRIYCDEHTFHIR